MSDRPDMVVPSIEGERWGELGARLTPQQRAAAVDALVGKLATRAMIDPDDLCPHCGATQGVCSDAQNAATRDNVASILTDLIAELVGDDGDGHEMTPDGEACAVCVAIDRAEARLREAGIG